MATDKISPASSPMDTIKMKKNLWILPMVAILVVFAGVIFVLIPQVKAINADRGTLKTETERLQRLVEKRQKLEQISEAELDSQLNIVTRALPDEKPINQALGLLMQTTVANEVKMAEYTMDPGEIASGPANPAQPEKEIKPGAMAALLVETQWIAAYNQIQNLIKTVESATVPFVRLTNLSMSIVPDQNDPNQTQTENDVALEMEYAPVPTTLGKPSDPLPEISASQLQLIEQLAQRQAVELDASTIPEGIEENKPNIFQY